MRARQQRASNRVTNRTVVAALFLLFVCLPAVAQEGTYQQGRQAMNQGRTEEAINDFCSLGGYKDAAQLCAQLRAQLDRLNRTNEQEFQNGVRAFQQGDYATARQYFEQVTGPRYNEAQQYINNRIPAAMKAGPAPGQQVTPLGSITFPKDSASLKTAKKQERTPTTPPPKQTPPVEVKAEVAPATPPPTDADAALREGLRAFYAASYAEAEGRLQQYLASGGARQGLADFYLGASKLSRFYLAGARNEDTPLFVEARTAFKQASKVEGFVLPEQQVSPKIIEVYRNSVQ